MNKAQNNLGKIIYNFFQIKISLSLQNKEVNLFIKLFKKNPADMMLQTGLSKVICPTNQR